MNQSEHLGWVGGYYGSLLHNSMFWGSFLGLQPSGAAARLCVPAEWFQRIILTTVANTQPERVVQYDSDAIATASLRKAITIYNIQGCTINYHRYNISRETETWKSEAKESVIYAPEELCSQDGSAAIWNEICSKQLLRSQLWTSAGPTDLLLPAEISGNQTSCRWRKSRHSNVLSAFNSESV